ncbi:hypothetical protein BH10PSE8_BH10PSE8_16420 [soil metagenome]
MPLGTICSIVDTEFDRRGPAQDMFREGLDPIDIHLTISALSF